MKKKIKFQEEKTNSKKPKIAARFVAAVLVATLSINGYYAYNMFGGDIAEASSYKGMNNEQIELLQERDAKKKDEEEAGFVSYTPTSLSDDIDTVIVDKGDAEKLFGELRYEMNLFDISDTFPFSYSRSNEYFDVYTMQQYHDGIEVYGREIKMTTDKAGNLLSVNGNPAKLNNFDTTVTLSEDDAYEYLEKYLKSEYQLTTDDVSIDYLGRKIGFDENDEPAMGYLFEITQQAAPDLTISLLKIMVNGNSEEIMFVQEQTQGATRSIDLQGQQVMQTLDVFVDENGRSEYLIDDERNIYVFDELGNISENPDILAETNKEAGVDFLANAQRAYDFYENNFDYHLGLVYLLIENAAKSKIPYFDYKFDYFNVFTNRTDTDDSVISLCEKTEPAIYLDIIGHEYTHAMLPDNILPNTAINEGLADLFGELIEDYSDGGFNNSCNWVMSNENTKAYRNLRDPNASDNASSIDDITNDYYHNSTIVPHSAYLMTQGINGTGALTTEDLAKLYFFTFDKIPSGDNFAVFRSEIELNAFYMNESTYGYGPYSDESQRFGITDSQWESVVDSFDRVGIERIYDYSLVPDAKIEVYDTNYKKYDNYHLEINKLNDGTIVVDEDIKTKSYTLPNLPKGIYQFTLTDLDNEDLIETYSVIINDNASGQKSEEYDSKGRFYTDFCALEKKVALVLDVSGSMDGTPLKETKNAAILFVKTVLDANPNVKISLITYSGSTNVLLESTNKRINLYWAIANLRSGGGTYMSNALSTAENILSGDNIKNKYVIFMSDGVPSDSPTDAANSIKENDIILCSLGFYHSSSEGAGLMSELASPGYYYNVQNTASIQGVFDEIARQVSGEEYVINEIKCPVEVVVSYNGETLCSAEENQNLRTSFGSITFEGEENEKKVLRLNNKADYEICIYGTGKGTMNYTVSYVDKDGNYTDVRKFEKVPIRKNTVISTQNSKSKKTLLKVDTDGDGKFDLQYSGNSRKTQKLKTDNSWKMLIIIPAVTLAIWLIIEIVLLIIRIKRNRVCANCGLKITKRKIRYCSKCGGPVNTYELFPKWTKPVGRKKAAFILKIVCVASCLLITAGTTIIYHSAANTVYLQIRNSDLVSAGIMYEKNIEDTNIPRSYLSTVTDIYLKKVEKAQSKGKISKGEAEDIYNAVAEMDMGKASDSANVKLESLSMTE